MQKLRPFIGVLLAMTLALTGLSAAYARGQADPAGSIVICRGLTVVTVLVDADGQPVEPPHICPDAATVLFVETGATTLPPAVALTWRRIDWSEPEAILSSRAKTQARARGPPSFL
ncbi:hypothetical protein KZZ07_05295 [Mameliella sp. CS4]|uniref:hypothetical protein n=1 Tax=Mameliella sp. CS4 TaxID=2862329 RepID=UPI001C5E9F60|nr:hypothetical protein [Mameliella sp. CS4]MBW4981954.1 hypothetical protein [Mameliella sp. CS4]